MEQTLSIGVNAYEANVAKRVGSNKYAFEVLCQMERLTREPEATSALIPKLNGVKVLWTVYLPSPPLVDLPKERPGFVYKVIPPSKMWTQWRLPLELYFGGAKHDVFLSLGHYSPRMSPFPTAICILDLAFLKFPQFFLKKDLYQLKEWTKYSVRQAKHIFTISKSSKNDIIEHYKRLDADITIAYPGVDQESKEETQLLDPFGQEMDALFQKYGISKGKYILSVGTIQPRKNIIHAIKAFELFNPRHDNSFKLVLIGKTGWLSGEFEQVVKTSPQKENIVLTGFIDDTEKQLLLRSCACTFLVGYYEGFGIPAIESMAAGVVPVVSNTASLPEVVGGFGILVDPYSVDKIADGFAIAVENPPTAMRRAEMFEWSKQFCWEESGKRILEALRMKFAKPTL